MKQVYIIKENNPKLLLFFAGWAADETPFKQYRPKGMDYMICYDYRTLDFDTSIFDRYRQVNVVAWSMGVWAGKIVLCNTFQKNIFSIAFNGSTYPISDVEGIPEETFQGTLDGLTPATLQKFMRRMCKDSAAYKAFMEITPRRDFDEVKEELRLIKEQFYQMTGLVYDNDESMDYKEKDRILEEYLDLYDYEYDYVFISNNDRIFPYENFRCNYDDTSESHFTVTDCAHYDEPMFRFLLQEVWEMPIDEFVFRLREMAV